jgi:hypothetical protein
MDMPVDQYTLYAEFGITAEKAQVLELAAGNLALSYLAVFVKPEEITPEVSEWFKAIVDDVNAKTLGRLLTLLKKSMALSDTIVAVIDEALERRNYLTHHFFRSHNYALYSEDGRKVMMAELKEIWGKLNQAHQLLEGMGTLMDKFGAEVMGRSPVDAAEVDQGLQQRGKRVDI